jgi:hypothetical protein
MPRHKISYDDLKEKLFDPRRKPTAGSIGGRRSNPKRACWPWGLPGDQAGEFLDLFRSTRWEREKFWEFLGLEGKPSPILPRISFAACWKKRGETVVDFQCPAHQDWLYAGGGLEGQDVWNARVNLPGSVGEWNWSYVAPLVGGSACRLGRERRDFGNQSTAPGGVLERRFDRLSKA